MSTSESQRVSADVPRLSRLPAVLAFAVCGCSRRFSHLSVAEELVALALVEVREREKVVLFVARADALGARRHVGHVGHLVAVEWRKTMTRCRAKY